MEKVKIILVGSSVKEYYELNDILQRHQISSEIIENKGIGDELGFGFEELIILLPAMVPIFIQLRKAFEAYLLYKKPISRRIKIILEKDDKKLEIVSEDGAIVDIEKFEKFFE